MAAWAQIHTATLQNLVQSLLRIVDAITAANAGLLNNNAHGFGMAYSGVHILWAICCNLYVQMADCVNYIFKKCSYKKLTLY